MPKSTKLTRSKANSAMAATRARLVAKSQRLERTMLMSAGGLALGAAEKAGKLPVSFAGIPIKLALGMAGHLIAMNASGATGRIASNVGDACLTVYAYAAGKAGAIIAGDEEDYELINMP